jgi:hypothetical protein
MIPAKINTTGNAVIDTETAKLAVHLRDSGMTEREAINEAQRIRDALLGAAVDAVRSNRTAVNGYASQATSALWIAWSQGNECAEAVVRGLTGNFGCRCTGWDGCPNPTACGTPQGCHCGA